MKWAEINKSAVVSLLRLLVRVRIIPEIAKNWVNKVLILMSFSQIFNLKNGHVYDIIHKALFTF